MMRAVSRGDGCVSSERVDEVVEHSHFGAEGDLAGGEEGADEFAVAAEGKVREALEPRAVGDGGVGVEPRFQPI